MLRPILVTLLGAICATSAIAQQQPRIISPEVHADRKVTFRLRAPNTTDVKVGGEFTKAPQPMIKDEAGVWSLTVGPLEPDIYGYSFRLDDVSVSDPANGLVKTGTGGPSSYFVIAGESPLPWSDRAVPHGIVHRHLYASKAIGDTREVVVYTPPGYDPESKTGYPVMYLLHGSGDTATGWTDFGKANLILDNLIAEGKAKPMLVVMPFGHAARSYDRTSENRYKNTDLFAQDLFEHVIPLVESKYRVQTDAKSRAIAGLSMGGGQSIWTGLNNTDKFAYVAGFSSSVSAGDADQRYAKLIGDKDAAGRLKLLWIAIGKDDFLLDANQKYDEWIKSKNIAHKYQVTEGAHTWRVWRRYLAELTPLLFR